MADYARVGAPGPVGGQLFGSHLGPYLFGAHLGRFGSVWSPLGPLLGGARCPYCFSASY